MKSTIKTAAWICAILLVSVSCYDDGTDCFDTATRISLYPDVDLFNADGTTVFLVEQNANQALRIANRAYVMENGRIVMEDSADKLLTDPAVQKAYLGM